MLLACLTSLEARTEPGMHERLTMLSGCAAAPRDSELLSASVARISGGLTAYMLAVAVHMLAAYATILQPHQARGPPGSPGSLGVALGACVRGHTRLRTPPPCKHTRAHAHTRAHILRTSTPPHYARTQFAAYLLSAWPFCPSLSGLRRALRLSQEQRSGSRGVSPGTPPWIHAAGGGRGDRVRSG